MRVRPQCRRGGAHLAITGLIALGTAACEDPGAGREERIVFLSSRDATASPSDIDPPTDVFVMNGDGSGVQNLTRAPARNLHNSVSVSPDGGRIAFATDRTTPGCPQIFTVHTDGSATAQVTTQGCNNLPRWSPDGARLAYLSWREGRAAVYTINTNGTDPRDLSTPTLAGAEGCTATQPPQIGLLGWATDGRVMFYHDRCGRGYRYFIAPGDGSGAAETLDYDASTAYWSPDGSRVAFVARWGSYRKVHVMNADGSNRRVLITDAVNDEMMPRYEARGTSPWSPDGTRLVIRRELWSAGGISESGVYVIDVDGSRLRRLPLSSVSFSGWSPRGDRLAFTDWASPGGREVYVVNANGTGLTNLTNNPADDYAIGWVRER